MFIVFECRQEIIYIYMYMLTNLSIVQQRYKKQNRIKIELKEKTEKHVVNLIILTRLK